MTPKAASPQAVTVVICTRNRPEMVREAIAAVHAQDHDGPVEVVVVFDQSDPDTSLAWEGTGPTGAPRRTTVTTNARVTGLAGARNTGILGATTDLVAFCDDDDVWLPHKLRAQVAAADAAPGATLVTCGIVVEYDGQCHPRSLDRDRVTFEELLADRHTELHPSTFLLRRSALLGEVGLVGEDVPGGFGEDYDLLLRAARVHPVVNVPEPGVRVRWGGQSFFFQRWATMAEGLTWMLQRFPEFETSPRGSARLRGQIAFAHAAQGDRRGATSWARGAVRRNWREPRSYLALAVASRVVTPARVMRTLHRHGKGI